MYHWIESIALKEGRLLNILRHQDRVDLTISSHQGKPISLKDTLARYDLPQKGYYKVRVLYGICGESKVELSPYAIRHLKSFSLVEAADLSYTFKFLKREPLEVLKKGGISDEVIITKGGFITDTTFSNLVFKRDGEWFTPTTYLLCGTQRAKLLELGCIKETKISVDNLASFSHFKLINAMMSLDNSPTYLIDLLR